MVPNLTKGRGIKGTALYVLHDVRSAEDRAIGDDLTPDHQTAHRVGMTATRNLSTDDPDLAWRLMCATAKNRDALKQAAGVHKGGKQAKFECGHVSLSWDHDAKPSRAEMLKAADGALAALGWEKAQALIVEHRDHDHAHCHIVVNLVCPDTGKALPNPKNDYDVLQKWAHEYDAAAGRTVCPNRAAKIEAEKAAREHSGQKAPDQPKAKKWLSRAEWEAQRAAANDPGTMPKKDRNEQIAAGVNRYREAAAKAREQMRPEWAELYKNQRNAERMLQRAQTATLRDLERAKESRIGQTDKQRLADFYNANTALVWQGIPADRRPGNADAILNDVALSRAVAAAHDKQRAELAAAHEVAKKELQVRHDAARQEAQRAAWKQPAKDAPKQPEAERPRERPTERPAERAASAQRAASPDAQRDLDASADRIRGRQPPPANDSRDREKRAADPQQEKRTQDSAAARSDPRADDFAKYRAQAEAEAAKMARIREVRNRQRFRNRGHGFDREPGLD